MHVCMCVCMYVCMQCFVRYSKGSVLSVFLFAYIHVEPDFIYKTEIQFSGFHLTFLVWCSCELLNGTLSMHIWFCCSISRVSQALNSTDFIASKILLWLLWFCFHLPIQTLYLWLISCNDVLTKFRKRNKLVCLIHEILTISTNTCIQILLVPASTPTACNHWVWILGWTRMQNFYGLLCIPNSYPKKGNELETFWRWTNSFLWKISSKLTISLRLSNIWMPKCSSPLNRYLHRAAGQLVSGAQQMTDYIYSVNLITPLCVT